MRETAAAPGMHRHPNPTTGTKVALIVQATAAKPIPIYLYHFPQQSGLPSGAGFPTG